LLDYYNNYRLKLVTRMPKHFAALLIVHNYSDSSMKLILDLYLVKVSDILAKLFSPCNNKKTNSLKLI